MCDSGSSCTVDAQCGPGVCVEGTCSCSVCSECGNGIVEDGEECDDGNGISGDGCSSCQFEEPSCALSFSGGSVLLGETGSRVISGVDTAWMSFDLLEYGDGTTESNLSTGTLVYEHLYASGGYYTGALTVSNALSGAERYTSVAVCTDIAQVRIDGVCGSITGTGLYDFDNNGDALSGGSPDLCVSGSPSTVNYDT